MTRTVVWGQLWLENVLKTSNNQESQQGSPPGVPPTPSPTSPLCYTLGRALQLQTTAGSLTLGLCSCCSLGLERPSQTLPFILLLLTCLASLHT